MTYTYYLQAAGLDDSPTAYAEYLTACGVLRGLSATIQERIIISMYKYRFMEVI